MLRKYKKITFKLHSFFITMAKAKPITTQKTVKAKPIVKTKAVKATKVTIKKTKTTTTIKKNKMENAPSVAYFSMEFAIDQILKIYSGGLGFLSGSHMRSAHDLNQNIVGVGMLWTYGYYDQVRKEDRSMGVLFQKKVYSFLEDTGVKVPVHIYGFKVMVKAFLLKPEVFGTVPIYLLTTDLPENDALAHTTDDNLYANNLEARISQQIVLGEGGTKILEALGIKVDIYHMNEAHALPLAFHLYSHYRNLDEVKKRLVFTTHTPEKAGNEVNDINFLNKIGFFNSLSLDEVREITKMHDNEFDHTLAALRMAKIANAVSQIHKDVSNHMWGDKAAICPIIGITNAQNKKYWVDPTLQKAHDKDDDELLIKRKKELKKELFKIVADQTGNIFDPDVLTLVWSRRFAEYKRASLIKRDVERFKNLITRADRPVQIIWAGKPYPFDTGATNLFNDLVYSTEQFKNCAVLTGYELALSAYLKKGSDVWLNTPRMTREASGTSGMTATMNGSINLSIADGWYPEFAKHGINGFIVPAVDHSLPLDEQDTIDNKNLLDILENEVIPTYYNQPKKWIKIMKKAMTDITPKFDSDRMAQEYYDKMYTYQTK